MAIGRFMRQAAGITPSGCASSKKAYAKDWSKQMTATYRLAGKRQGWDFKGCTREDMPDGYTEFRKPNGTVHAVVMTALLTPEKDDE